MYLCTREGPHSPFILQEPLEPAEITAKLNGGLRYAARIHYPMDILLDYFNGEFRTIRADFSKVRPFSHADVIVNCDELLSRINGPLEREVEKFLSKMLASASIKPRWDHSSEWTQSKKVVEREFPRINKLKLGINFDI